MFEFVCQMGNHPFYPPVLGPGRPIFICGGQISWANPAHLSRPAPGLHQSNIPSAQRKRRSAASALNETGRKAQAQSKS